MYKIIEERSVYDLENEVIRRLKMGYKLSGGPFVYDGWETVGEGSSQKCRKFCQAVTGLEYNAKI